MDRAGHKGNKAASLDKRASSGRGSREGNVLHSIKSRMVTDRVTKEKRPEWPGHSDG